MEHGSLEMREEEARSFVAYEIGEWKVHRVLSFEKKEKKMKERKIQIWLH